jgi:hypothetical protein
MPTLEGNIHIWFISSHRHKVVPFLVLWGIWHYRNKIVFEDWARNDATTSSRIVLAIKNFPVPNKGECFDFILNPIYFDNNFIGFFLWCRIKRHLRGRNCIEVQHPTFLQSTF